MAKFIIERTANITKGVANPRRIAILVFLQSKQNLQTIDAIGSALHIHYKTLTVHLQRLERSGLIYKKYISAVLQVGLTERGSMFLNFLRKLE